jgi:hypothetical protein
VTGGDGVTEVVPEPVLAHRALLGGVCELHDIEVVPECRLSAVGVVGPDQDDFGEKALPPH